MIRNPARRGATAFVLLWLALSAPSGEATTATTSAAPPQIAALARWQFRGGDGAAWAHTPPIIPGGKVGTILGRTSFNVREPAAAAFWQLAHALPPRMDMGFALNGEEVPVPLKGMYYKTIPAIPARLLRKGRNELTATIRIDNRPPRNDRLRDMPPFTFAAPEARPVLAGQRLEFQTGPALGAFGEDFFTVTCRTNVPAKVALSALEAADRKLRKVVQISPTGLFHRFLVKNAPNKAGEYLLAAESTTGVNAHARKTLTRPVFPGKAVRFVIMGDSRSRTEDWAAVAAAVLSEKPDFVVFTGDMCSRGTNDWEWDEHYFAPESARSLLATVPFYPVKGNHEENAPLYDELFYTPGPNGKAENWSQQIGPVLLIGINGQWSPRWKHTYRRVENTLAESKAKFIFFVSHYPAWSSGGNGKLDERTGQPAHWAYQTGRKVIVPMLARHKATAFVVSHEHHYERSELPGGVVQIIAGGAGAPRSGKRPQAKAQNPYSKVFAKTLHYCLFEIKGNACTFRAKTPEGRVVDTLTWRSRTMN